MPRRKNPPTLVVSEEPLRPSREEAEEAVRTLLRWANDDPSREGLEGTPGRVVRAYDYGIEGEVPFFCRLHGSSTAGMHGLLIFH